MSKHLLFTVFFWLILSPSMADEAADQFSPEMEAEEHSIAYRIEQPFFGDLDEMRDRHIIRVLVSFNRTNFFQTHKGFRGLEYDLLKAYEAYLNRGPRKKRYQTHLTFIPVSFDQTLEKLQAGLGDIAAAGITITKERDLFVDFTSPYITNIHEVLVSNINAPFIEKLEDLSGKQVVVVSNSSHVVHLEQFNQALGLLGLEGMEIVRADPLFEGEDLLNLVNQGIYDYTVTDSHIAEIWEEVMDNIFIHDQIRVFHNSEIAWAIQNNTPKLKASLNRFIKAYAKPGRKLGNQVFQKYYADTYWIKKPLTNSLLTRTEGLKENFIRYSEFYDFDWHLIAAQAYQESRFNHKKRSSAGAIGIMQIKASTAKDKNVNIKNIKDMESNIHAGVKYLAFLKERYFSSEEYTEENSENFALAAYNAGPRKVLQMQNRAEKMGLNRYKWYKNVEIIARKMIGHETVNYVTGIQKMRRFLATSEKMQFDKMMRLDEATQIDIPQPTQTAEENEALKSSYLGAIDLQVRKTLIN